MEQSPSWEANWFAASREIPPIIFNLYLIFLTHTHVELYNHWIGHHQSLTVLYNITL